MSPPPDRLRALHEHLMIATLIATDYVAPHKAEALARSLAESAADSEGFCDDQVLFDAHGYALNLLLFQPSPSGQRAVDRARRQGRFQTPEDQEAADLLSSSTFRLIQLEAPLGNEKFRARDLVDGESLVFCDLREAPHAPMEGAWALNGCRFEGLFLATGFLTPLSDAMLEAARPFVVPGQGLKNPERCAETLARVYLHAMNAALAHTFPFTAADGPLHVIALRWAEATTLPEPTPNDLTILRLVTDSHAIFETLAGLHAGHALNQPGHAAAYERVLVIQLETVHRRTLLGLHLELETLEILTAHLRQGIAQGHLPPECESLFVRACQRARLAVSAKAPNVPNRDGLDKVLMRIQALRSKTLDQGCTEEEALAAADKVAELLERYGLSLSAMDLHEQSCGSEGFETDRRRPNAFDQCVSILAEFCDCRTWTERTVSGCLRHVVFGLPADVAGARCLYEKVDKAFETETRAFKQGKLYSQHPSSHRRTATTSFQAGLQQGICSKLRALKTARTRACLTTTGRDLVPVKEDIIADEMSALGLNLTFKTVRASRVLGKAYHLGRVIGENLAWDDKINDHPEGYSRPLTK